MMKRKNYILFQVIIFVLLVGSFYNTEPEIKELIIFTVLTGLVIVGIYLTNRYYMTDNSSFKQGVILLCMYLVIITVFHVVAKELIGFSLDYALIVLFMVIAAIKMIWMRLNITTFEKGVLVLTLISVLGVTVYQNRVTKNSTAIDLYRSEVRGETNFESFQELFLQDYRENITLKEFRDLVPYLQQSPLRHNQPVLLEFEDGQMVMIEVGISQELNSPLRIRDIELLPEKIASYFRYYPLEIERKADSPKGKEGDESIIEARGAFLSRASSSQERDWYDKLISVFGKKEAWDELWGKLEGLYAPEGPVIGSGTNNQGYLEFRFYNDWEVDNEVLNKIYNVFQDKASEYGITDLPVVFRWH